jgi:hypothetical protein
VYGALVLIVFCVLMLDTSDCVRVIHLAFENRGKGRDLAGSLHTDAVLAMPLKPAVLEVGK